MHDRHQAHFSPCPVAVCKRQHSHVCVIQCGTCPSKEESCLSQHVSPVHLVLASGAASCCPAVLCSAASLCPQGPPGLSSLRVACVACLATAMSFVAMFLWVVPVPLYGHTGLVVRACRSGQRFFSPLHARRGKKAFAAPVMAAEQPGHWEAYHRLLASRP